MHKRFDGETSMDIRPLKTEADYQAALKEIETLMHAAADTAEPEERLA